MSVQRVRTADRFGLAALAAAGTLVAHEVGYLTGDAPSVSHAYLGLVGPLVVLAAGVAAWIAAVRILRHDPGRRPSLRALAGVQTALFLAMEVGERLASGSLGSLVSIPVLVGLVLQPLIAFAALRLVGLGGHLVHVFEAWRHRHRRAGTFVLPIVMAPIPVAVQRLELARLRVRGPPV